MNSTALWCTGSGQAELRDALLGEGVLVENLFSGISRGTEKLVFDGLVPKSEADRMRCFGQEGDFSFPVKFGYCSVGRVLEGELSGRNVFVLHPHQKQFRAPFEQLHVLPDGLSPEKAILAANMETALNISWDSQASAGDKIAVIGAGVIGLLAGYLLAKIPGSEVTVIDKNSNRAAIAKQLGLKFTNPEAAPVDCDVVIHTSASSDGLALAIDIAGFEAKIIEASWYGDREVVLSLGGAFHSQRLSLISSQVGSLPQTKKPRWDHNRRMTKALELLLDPELEVLISGESKFEDIATEYGGILHDPETLCHRIRY
jgi:threonine dehydrogenase-like Zn-dependent dehydrogenase